MLDRFDPARRIRWAAKLATLVALISPLWGVQMIPMSLEELVTKADVVVHARVTSKTCQRDPGGRIFTSVGLEVFEVWKGALPRRPFQIVLAGGTLGSRRVLVSGQADYVPGEEVVAFLRLNAQGQGVTLGLAQGKFNVREETGTHQKFVHNLFLGYGDGAAGAVPTALGSGRATSASLNSAGTGRIALLDLKRRLQGGPR